MENRRDPRRAGVIMAHRSRGALGAALVCTLAFPATPAVHADEPVRIATADAVLDRNGDGFRTSYPPAAPFTTTSTSTGDSTTR